MTGEEPFILKAICSWFIIENYNGYDMKICSYMLGILNHRSIKVVRTFEDIAGFITTKVVIINSESEET